MNFKEYYKMFTETYKRSSEQRINLIYGNKFTSGQHAFGQNEREVPARDPLSLLEIHPVYVVTPEIENFFKENIKTVTLQKIIGGSYHERWATACATTVISIDQTEWEEWKEKLENAEDLNSFNTYITDSPEEKEISYFSMQQVKDELEDFVFSHPSFNHAAKSGETREQYWQRMIKKYTK